MRKSIVLFAFLMIFTILMCVQSVESALITEQTWTFSTNDNPADADAGYVNPGSVAPTATIAFTAGDHDTNPGWVETNFLGRDGVWHGQEVDIVLDIPNFINENPHKMILLDVIFKGDPVNYTAEILDPATGVTELVSTVSAIGTTGWSTLHAEWKIVPNPDFEQIHLYFVDSGAAVDEVYVWTECVPEPATIMLLSLGGLLLRRRKSA